MASSRTFSPPVPGTPSRGIALMVAGALLVPGLDTAAKMLGENHAMPAGQIAFARFALQTVMVLPFLLYFEGRTGLRVRHARLNLLRGVLLALASFVFFIALKSMPLADAIAIFFVEPMIVTLLSVVFLREALDLRRVVAVVVGFAGALVVIRPNFLALGLVATLPLVCAVLVAFYLVLGRHLSATVSSLSMHFYAGIGGSVSLGALLLANGVIGLSEFDVIVPRGTEIWSLLLVIGVVATIAHLLFIQAYRLTPASLLAPFGYFEIVSATLLGLAVFGDFPDAMKCLGIAIIVASGLMLVWSDRAMASGPPPPGPV